MIYWSLILGILFIVYFTLINIISSRIISFSQAFLLMGILFILFHFFRIRILENRILYTIIKNIKTPIIVILIILLIVDAAIIFYPKPNNGEAHYLMVLGAGLVNKTQPNKTLCHRLDKAIDVFNGQSPSSYIIVSGGQGPNEDISEATAMKTYLENHNIPPNRIIMEDKSINTLENFKFSLPIIENHSKKNIETLKIKLITTDFHALRSSMLAQRMGYKNIDFSTSKCIWYLIPVNYTREALAYVKSLLFDR